MTYYLQVGKKCQKPAASKPSHWRLWKNLTQAVAERTTAVQRGKLMQSVCFTSAWAHQSIYLCCWIPVVLRLFSKAIQSLPCLFASGCWSFFIKVQTCLHIIKHYRVIDPQFSTRRINKKNRTSSRRPTIIKIMIIIITIVTIIKHQ